jgi:uncharacterized membrane protein
MTPIELLKPWRIIVSLIPCLYASLLIVELNNTLQWALMAAVAIVALSWFVNSLGYPILVCLPTYAGALLLIACLFVLFQGLPNHGLLPVTRSFFELWAMVAFGLGYIGWGMLSAWRVMYRV